MRTWILGLCAVLIGGAMVIGEVEAAKRLGGGRPAGAQRSITNTPAPQKAAPAQQAGQQAAPQAGAAAQPQSGFARWAPLLGGLALGGLLGYLFSGQGMGVLLLLVLAVIAAVVMFRMMAAKRREAPQPMQYAGSGFTERVLPGEASQGPMAATSSSSLPAGFDAAGFLKGAKMNFIRLQAANDAGSAHDIREFTTDEMFTALKADIDARGSAAQKTDVVSLDASLLEVVTEGDKHWASVHFAGTIREDDGPAEGFAEVWNLVKPVDGSSGWLLAGIQQMN